MKFLLYKVPHKKMQTALEKKGLRDTFILEEKGQIFIGGHADKAIIVPEATLVEEKRAEVNWEEQWALFAKDFRDGKAHIPVGDKTLLLWPGPGFGDLSHPTTWLVLSLLKKYGKGDPVLDIGTGSGILALAALLLGAKSALGIDIDPSALKHARKNSKLNHLKAKFSRLLPRKMGKNQIILMNMIFPEQQQFQPARLNSIAKLWIVSGILKKQKRAYLAQARQWGWKKIAEREKKGWLGFVFSSSQEHASNPLQASRSPQ
jgi:ribosomal protein L11 methyltransferase